MRRYGHSNIPRWRPAAVLDLIEPEIAPFLSIRSPQKPYYKTKHEVDRVTRCGDMAIEIRRITRGAFGTPNFGGRGGRGGVIDRTIRKSDVGFL